MKFMIFSDASDLSKQIMTYLRGKGDFFLYTTEDKPELLSYGAAKVTVIQGDQTPESLSSFLSSEFKSNGFESIFIASSVIGRDVASYLVQSLGLKVIPEIYDVSINGSTVKTKRYGLGGKVVLEEESDAKIFTFIPGISDDNPSGGNSILESKEIQKGRVSITAVKPKKGREVDLEKANIIVSVGRGLGKKEGIQQIEPFVKMVKGELAGSRPVCLDYKWLSEDRQVGYSGRKVKPKIYIALGISGQIQHIAGMRDSKIVIAVNKDKSAPIFQEADYGIVGDLYQVVPKIMSYLS